MSRFTTLGNLLPYAQAKRGVTLIEGSVHTGKTGELIHQVRHYLKHFREELLAENATTVVLTGLEGPLFHDPDGDLTLDALTEELTTLGFTLTTDNQYTSQVPVDERREDKDRLALIAFDAASGMDYSTISFIASQMDVKTFLVHDTPPPVKGVVPMTVTTTFNDPMDDTIKTVRHPPQTEQG